MPTIGTINPCYYYPIPLLKSCHYKVLPQHCDRFYLGFIRFSLIPYLLIASVSKPRKTF